MVYIYTIDNYFYCLSKQLFSFNKDLYLYHFFICRFVLLQIYTDWANHYLEKAKNKHTISDLQQDVSDGVLLAEVIEAVSKCSHNIYCLRWIVSLTRDINLIMFNYLRRSLMFVFRVQCLYHKKDDSLSLSHKNYVMYIWTERSCTLIWWNTSNQRATFTSLSWSASIKAAEFGWSSNNFPKGMSQRGSIDRLGDSLTTC